MLFGRNITKQYIKQLFFIADNVRLSNVRVTKDILSLKKPPLLFETALYDLENDRTINTKLSILKNGGLLPDITKKTEIPEIHDERECLEPLNQSLADLYTIYKSFPSINNLKMLFIGDIKYSRAVHSLLNILKLYPQNKIFFLPYYNKSPDYELLFDTAYNHNQYTEDLIIDSEELYYNEYDIYYCTSMREGGSYENAKSDFTIDKQFINNIKKKNAIIIHSFPTSKDKNLNIYTDIHYKNVQYMNYGIDIRRALIIDILNFSE